MINLNSLFGYKHLTLILPMDMGEILKTLKEDTLIDYGDFLRKDRTFFGSIQEDSFQIFINRPRSQAIVTNGRLLSAGNGTSLYLSFTPSTIMKYFSGTMFVLLLFFLIAVDPRSNGQFASLVVGILLTALLMNYLTFNSLTVFVTNYFDSRFGAELHPISGTPER